MPRFPSTRSLIRTVLVAGTVGALAMPVAGTATKPFLGWHVWLYGKRVASMYIAEPNALHLLVQSFLLAWLAATPLVWLLLRRSPAWPLLVGAGYGGAYYAVTNMVALPLFFGDPLPWQQSTAHLVQPLIVHVAFGVGVAWVARRSAGAPPRPDTGTARAPGLPP